MEIINWLNQNDGFFLVLLTFVYVVATIITVYKMSQSNKIAQKNIEVFTELEKDKNRPSLVFSIEPIKTILLQAKIENIGATTAQNVSIQIEPKIRRISSNREIKFISEGIPSLPPGANLSTLIGSFEEFANEYEEKAIIGYLKYERLDGKTYKEEFNFDISVFEGLSYIKENGIHEIGKEVEKIREEIHLLATGFRKPLIRIIEEDEYQEKRRKEIKKAKKDLEMIREKEQKKKESNGS